MQEIRKREHITDEMWIALQQDTVGQAAFMQILEHTCSCTWCAERMASALGPDGPQEGSAAAVPPAYLTQQILERTEQLDVQAAVSVRQASKTLQLFLYGMKIGAAVAFSILVLGITANFQDAGFAQIERPAEAVQQEEDRTDVLNLINRAANGVTDKMNEFANLLLNGGKSR